MSPYVCDCTNVVYMFCVYCIYYYVNKFEARSLFSTSHLKHVHYVIGLEVLKKQVLFININKTHSERMNCKRDMFLSKIFPSLIDTIDRHMFI